MGNVTIIGGSQGAAHETSLASSRQQGTTAVYQHPVGTRARDASGNEYIYVEFGETVKAGAVVGITPAKTACLVLVEAFRGPVGVVMGSTTSDTAGWVQIYGTNSRVQHSGAATATSSMFWIAASSVSTPATGAVVVSSAVSDPAYFIYGMWPTAVDDTASETSDTSFVGASVPAYLNYPYVLGILQSQLSTGDS